MSHSFGKLIVPVGEGASHRLGKLCGQYRLGILLVKTTREELVPSHSPSRTI